MNEPEHLAKGMFADSLPGNPKPFAHALTNFDSISIQSDQAKMILWTLMAMAYGQAATIDLYDEWRRLNEVRKNNEETQTQT